MAARAAPPSGSSVDGFSPRRLRNYYLLNPEEERERHYKLLLSQTDNTSLTAIVGGGEQPKERSLRVTENFSPFKSLIAGWEVELDVAGALLEDLIRLWAHPATTAEQRKGFCARLFTRVVVAEEGRIRQMHLRGIWRRCSP